MTPRVFQQHLIALQRFGLGFSFGLSKLSLGDGATVSDHQMNACITYTAHTCKCASSNSPASDTASLSSDSDDPGRSSNTSGGRTSGAWNTNLSCHSTHREVLSTAEKFRTLRSTRGVSIFGGSIVGGGGDGGGDSGRAGSGATRGGGGGGGGVRLSISGAIIAARCRASCGWLLKSSSS